MPTTSNRPRCSSSTPVAATVDSRLLSAVSSLFKAAASDVQVAVDRVDGVARIEIADDGSGGADPSRGTGLRGLADRLALVGGRLDVISPVGAGTRVTAEIPVG